MKPEYLAWLLSITSGAMLWLMGNKSKWGPRLGLLNQVLWIIYAVWLKQWGLLPGVVLYIVIHARNLHKWERRERIVRGFLDWNHLIDEWESPSYANKPTN